MAYFTTEELSITTSDKQFSLTVRNYPLISGLLKVKRRMEGVFAFLAPFMKKKKTVIIILFLLESYKKTMQNLTNGSSKSVLGIMKYRLILQRFSALYYKLTSSFWSAVFYILRCCFNMYPKLRSLTTSFILGFFSSDFCVNWIIN